MALARIFCAFLLGHVQKTMGLVSHHFHQLNILAADKYFLGDYSQLYLFPAQREKNQKNTGEISTWWNWWKAGRGRRDQFDSHGCGDVGSSTTDDTPGTTTEQQATTFENIAINTEQQENLTAEIGKLNEKLNEALKNKKLAEEKLSTNNQ